MTENMTSCQSITDVDVAKCSYAQFGVKTPKFSFGGFNSLCRVVGIHDGDTMSVIMVIFERFHKINLRLVGIDTCEITSKNSDLKKQAQLARARLIKLITGQDIPVNATKKQIESLLDSEIFLVNVRCYDFDKWGRTLADVIPIGHTESISQTLLRERLAYVYGGEEKMTEQRQLEYFGLA